MSISRDRLREHLAIAERHVLEGRNVVSQQEQHVEELRRRGANTWEAEHQLDVLKQTLDLFEEDYREIKRELDTL